MDDSTTKPNLEPEDIWNIIAIGAKLYLSVFDFFRPGEDMNDTLGRFQDTLANLTNQMQALESQMNSVINALSMLPKEIRAIADESIINESLSSARAHAQDLQFMMHDEQTLKNTAPLVLNKATELNTAITKIFDSVERLNPNNGGDLAKFGFVSPHIELLSKAYTYSMKIMYENEGTPPTFRDHGKSKEIIQLGKRILKTYDDLEARYAHIANRVVPEQSNTMKRTFYSYGQDKGFEECVSYDSLSEFRYWKAGGWAIPPDDRCIDKYLGYIDKNWKLVLQKGTLYRGGNGYSIQQTLIHYSVAMEELFTSQETTENDQLAINAAINIRNSRKIFFPVAEYFGQHEEFRAALNSIGNDK